MPGDVDSRVDHGTDVVDHSSHHATLQERGETNKQTNKQQSSQ